MAKSNQMTTPKGVFKYTHLNKPDIKGAEKFGGDPMYRTTFVIERDAPGFDAFMAELEKRHQAAYAAGEAAMDEANPKQKAAWKKKKITEPTLNDFYDDEVDEEGTPTGRVEFKFKTKAEFKDRKTGELVKKHVPFVDGRGKIIPMKKRPLVYGGSEGRVAFSTGDVFIPKDADVYLGFYLNQVQITKLSEGGGGSAFGADEDSDFDADELDEYEGNAKDDDLDDDDLGDEDEGDQDTDGGDDLDDDIPF